MAQRSLFLRRTLEVESTLAEGGELGGSSSHSTRMGAFALRRSTKLRASSVTRTVEPRSISETTAALFASVSPAKAWTHAATTIGVAGCVTAARTCAISWAVRKRSVGSCESAFNVSMERAGGMSGASSAGETGGSLSIR